MSATTQLRPERAGRLTSRPQPGIPPRARQAASPGLHGLGLGTERDGLVYVPARYQTEQPCPLVVMLHGAGGNAQHGLAPFHQLADRATLLLLAIESRHQTWDVIVDDYGPDVKFLNEALECVFDRYAVNPRHLAVEGFSDGASYALSLGLINGDLFTHVIAFAPGFMRPVTRAGKPRIFISHGTLDHVLPIDHCSRRLVPKLMEAGYDVDYREFTGLHLVPRKIARDALSWFTGRPVK